MAKVSDLKVALQSGTDNTLYATWGFVQASPEPENAKPKVGDTVSIREGATYYSGAHIPSWVMAKQWIILQITGVRAVIDKAADGSARIMSSMHIDDLIPVKSTQTPTAGNTLDHYSVEWRYDSGNAVWFAGSSSDTEETNAIYSMPSNAVKVKVTVTPVSQTYQSNDQDIPYWTGIATSAEYIVSSSPPGKLATPSVSLDKYTLKASIENIEDSKAEEVEFEVYRGDTKFTSGIQTIVTARAIFSCTVTAGERYRVRCRAINNVGTTKIYGEWSPYSTEVTTIPKSVTNVKCTVESETSVRLEWTGDKTATQYTVEYTTNKLYFDSSNEVSSISVTNTYAYITGLETGEEWYFRVRANNDEGKSGWSDIVYKVIGTKPEPPTTWSLTTTAVVGEPAILYWVHNTEDGSKQTQAQIELTINGSADIITVNTDEELEEEETDKIYSYTLDLSDYTEGAEVLWRVRTRGITYEYSEWSIQRTIDIYAPPTVELRLGNGNNVLSSFPYNISAIAGPDNQKVLTYHISIFSEYAYETTNQIGETVYVNAGTEIFSKIYKASSNELSYDLMAEDITLENNQSYNVVVTVSMDSGLTAEASELFLVIWTDEIYEPDASIMIDKNLLCTYIIPTCFNKEGNFTEDVVLAVYRRESNGDFTEIGSGIDNNGSVTVTDPHPSLDYARYRIVARNRNTNVNSYSDLPGIPVGESAIVIQWDEEWSQFDYSGQSEPVVPPWTGSMLKLPYNVDTSENYDVDSSLVEYIGRHYPVSYYGTQRGVSESWSTEVPKNDKETIYALRRLSAWDGDVYVREPSGNGYRANVKVSWSIKHDSLIIPVKIEVKRVEGDG